MYGANSIGMQQGQVVDKLNQLTGQLGAVRPELTAQDASRDYSELLMHAESVRERISLALEQTRARISMESHNASMLEHQLKLTEAFLEMVRQASNMPPQAVVAR